MRCDFYLQYRSYLLIIALVLSLGTANTNAELLSLYNNGATLQEYGEPASQLSLPPASLAFSAAAADDFAISAPIFGEDDVLIKKVHSAFAFFNDGAETASPLTHWEGIQVVVFGNSTENRPDGAPDGSGGFEGNVIQSQYVPIGSLQNVTAIEDRMPYFELDIPVNLLLAQDTTYWLSLIPVSPGLPQTAWMLSNTADLGEPAQRLFPELGIDEWITIDGNVDWLPDSPPAGTYRELSFELFGVPEPSSALLLCIGLALIRRR